MNTNRKKLKNGRTAYTFRFTDPITKKRTHATFRAVEKRDAEDAFRQHMKKLEARKLNLPDNSGWETPFADLVKRFLEQSALSTTRQSRLKRVFEANVLGVKVGAELANKGPLTEKCKALMAKRGDVFVIKCVQQPLKQLTAWAASDGIFPYDPLASWKKFKRTSHAKEPRAFTPEDVRAILDATAEIDAAEYRSFSSALIFKTVLIAGNRPGAVFAATVGDLEENRIRLSPGCGKKFNGCAMMPAAFVTELRESISQRGKVSDDDSLLVMPSGCKVDGRNIRDTFTRAAILACVKMNWPTDVVDDVTARDVALAIDVGKVGGFDGVPPKDEAKKEARLRKAAAIDALVRKLKPVVTAFLKDRLIRELRHTHITWARALGINNDFVDAQVGHRGGSVQNRHYKDQRFQDAMQSAQAVWDVLTGARSLDQPGRAPLAVDLKTDLKADLAKIDSKKNATSISEVAGGEKTCKNASWRTRTSDPVIKSHLLYQLS